ncbi:MAG: hypothetical protein ACOVOL_01030, partial [Bacteroidia bacterium]
FGFPCGAKGGTKKKFLRKDQFLLGKTIEIEGHRKRGLDKNPDIRRNSLDHRTGPRVFRTS